MSLHEESFLVAGRDEVAPEEEGSGVEAVVRGEKRGRSLQFMDAVFGGLVCWNPCGIIVRVLDLGQSIDRLPLQTFQSRKLDLRCGIGDAGGPDSGLVDLDLRFLAVDNQVLGIDRSANHLNRGSGVKISSEMNVVALQISSPHEIAGLDDERRCSYVLRTIARAFSLGWELRDPVVVGRVPI